MSGPACCICGADDVPHGQLAHAGCAADELDELYGLLELSRDIAEPIRETNRPAAEKIPVKSLTPADKVV